MAFAASRMELELCFEDVARNVFGNEDGTMTRPQLAAILGADTGLALKPAELKVFISEFDVKERVTAEVFCAIYSYLASRPATPAPAEWAIDCVKAAFEKCGPAGPDKEVDKELLVSELEGMNLRDKGPVILASVKKKAPAVVDWPTVEKLARAGIGLVAGPEDASTTGGGGDAGAAGGGDAGAAAGAPAPDAVAAATAFLSQPLARLVAAAGATFPPDHVVNPNPSAGSTLTEVLLRDDAGLDASAAPLTPSPGGDWRAYDGGGQYENMPFLGAAGAPFSLCVKSHRVVKASAKLPSAREVVTRLHVRRADSPFVTHPNDVNAVLLAFATLVANELGLGGDVRGKAHAPRNEKSSYLDLQSLYGASEAEAMAFREKTGGRVLAIAGNKAADACDDAVVAALLKLLRRNHNFVADNVAKELGADPAAEDEKIFQIARHLNAAVLRSIFLKDYMPYLTSGQHVPEVPPMPPMAEPSAPGKFGVNGSVELDLMFRGLAAMEPEDGPIAHNKGKGGMKTCEALIAAANRRCGLPTRCNIPQRHADAEIAAVERARAVGVCALNEFREQMGLQKWGSFEEMTREPELATALASMYATVDDVELYTGLLCEYNVQNTGVMLPHTTHACALPLNVVAADKFFQASRLADEAVYTEWGVEHVKSATLAGLILEHTSRSELNIVEGASVFEVGAFAKEAPETPA